MPVGAVNAKLQILLNSIYNHFKSYCRAELKLDYSNMDKEVAKMIEFICKAKKEIDKIYKNSNDPNKDKKVKTLKDCIQFVYSDCSKTIADNSIGLEEKASKSGKRLVGTQAVVRKFLLDMCYYKRLHEIRLNGS